MVKIKFLGACEEVGRSGVLFESEESGDKILCDYGTKSDYTQLFPEHISGKDLSAIVLSHSHIDHCGGIPLFYISGSVPFYSTELTFRVSDILIQDMLKISKEYLPFGRNELYKMRKYANFLDYGQRKKVGKNSYITLYNAGHIPGSAQILIEMDGKVLLYTGDIKTTETKLVNPANSSDIPEIDIIITETTYGTTDHSDRRDIENNFTQEIIDVLDNKGIALIPAFGVSRSQEIMMVLSENENISGKITVDGMARKIALLYENYPKMFKDFNAYEKSLQNCHFIHQRKRDQERKAAATHSGVIIAPSGMLKGGTAKYYAENLIDSELNSINLVSYQIEETPGRILIDKNIFKIGESEEIKQVKSRVNHFDFSSHSGKSDLIQYLNSLRFKNGKKVFCVHGDIEVMQNFALSIKNFGYDVEIPKIGSVYTI